MTRRIAPLLPLAALLLAPACAHDKLHESFGITYNAVFGAQREAHAGRDATALHADEAHLIHKGYMRALGGGDDSGSSSSGAGNTIMGSLFGAGSTKVGATNPFAMKAH